MSLLYLEASLKYPNVAVLEESGTFIITTLLSSGLSFLGGGFSIARFLPIFRLTLSTLSPNTILSGLEKYMYSNIQCLNFSALTKLYDFISLLLITSLSITI